MDYFCLFLFVLVHSALKNKNSLKLMNCDLLSDERFLYSSLFIINRLIFLSSFISDTLFTLIFNKQFKVTVQPDVYSS